MNSLYSCLSSNNNYTTEQKNQNENEDIILLNSQKEQFDRIDTIQKSNINLSSKYQQRNDNDYVFSNQSNSNYHNCEKLFETTENLKSQEQNGLTPDKFSQNYEFRQDQFITFGNLSNIANQINYQQNKKLSNSEYIFQSNSSYSISDSRYIQIQYTDKSIISFSQINDGKNDEENNGSNQYELYKLFSFQSTGDYPCQKMLADLAFKILSNIGQQEIEEEEENSQLVFKDVSINKNSILKLVFEYIENNYILIAKFSNSQQQHDDDKELLDLLDECKLIYSKNSEQILATTRIQEKVLKYFIINANIQQNISFKE